jgi:hypothetical protein
MTSGAGRLADEMIRANEGLADFISQLFTAEVRSAVAAAGGQLLSFADQLRTALAPLLERLMAVLSEPRAADYEALLSTLAMSPPRRGYGPFG